MNIRTALISILPFGLLGIAACTAAQQSASPADNAAATVPAVIEDAPTTMVDTTVVELTDTSLAPTSTAPATTQPPLPPPPQPTLPPPPPPSLTIPPVIVPAPVCPVADPEHEPVEFLITDFGVLVNGEEPPSCLRIPESFAVRFVNNAEGDATVDIGFGPQMVAAGVTVNSAPLGDMFFVGDTFEITIAELGVSVEVKVIAA